MSRVLIAMVVLGVTQLACVHATTTRSQEKSAPSREVSTPAAKSEGAPAARSEGAEKPEPQKRPEAMTTSSTTKAMFKTEGLKKLQAALAKRSFAVTSTGQLDIQTQEGLRKFQQGQSLPDTGLPDYESIRRLGLKPQEVYEPEPPAERKGVP